MGNPVDNRNLAMNWINAFNDHSLEDLLALYAEEAVHYSPKLKSRQPETGGWISGKEALRTWWADAFERLPALHYQLVNLVADEQQAVMEYKRSVPGEPDMMVAEFLEMNWGKIVRSRVYHG